MRIKGNIKNIFYRSNDFLIGTIYIKESEDESYEKTDLVFSGKFNNLSVDTDCVLFGSIFEHPTYGTQFKVESYEKILPEEKNSIVSFLSSGLFSKIGIKTAMKIVEKFKENTLEVILEDYEQLLKIKGMTLEKSKMMYSVLLEEKESYKTTMYLQELGFTFNQANKIYVKYKLESKNIVNTNIYELIKIDGISFLTVDKIAFNLDYEMEDERRIQAAMLYCINEICFETKNTYVNLDEIEKKFKNLLNLNIDLKYYLSKLNEKNEVIIIKDKYYLKNFYEAEINIAKKIIKLIKNENISYDEKYINILEKIFNIKYNELQKESIKNFIENNVSIITGGPGTGKTTIIRAIIEVYKNVSNKNEEQLLEDIVLLAPTGRAAKRMQEATKFDATTIHKFLQYNMEKDEFLLMNSDVKLVIIDEASMIDVLLFESLLKVLKDDVKVLLVGDYNQLPSILPGQVLKDLIDSQLIKTTYLKELYRQKEKSYIIELAKKINEEDVIDIETKKSDFLFIECNKYQGEDYIIELCKKAIERNYSYKDIQVLAPVYKGLNGIDNLNLKLQEIFNPKDKSKNEIEFFKTIYRENDKVLQIKNLSNSNISNGDIGIIKYIGNQKDNYKVIIEFDNEEVHYNKNELENIKLGYAISIHKSQGSEFDVVIMPLFDKMLYKKLIYTAVTRAKKSLTIVGQKESLIKGIENKKEENRLTTLKEHIIQNI